MFQSSHVSDGELLAALVHEYAASISRLALARLGDWEEARWVSREVLAKSVLQRHRYWGETPVEDWLKVRALNLCRKITFQRKLRPLFFLRHNSAAGALHPAGRALQDVDLGQITAQVEARIAGLRARKHIPAPAAEYTAAGVVLLVIAFLAVGGRLLPLSTAGGKDSAVPSPTRHPTITPPPPPKGVFFLRHSRPRRLPFHIHARHARAPALRPGREILDG